MPFHLDFLSWLPWLLAFTLTIIFLASTRIINEGNQALVERMGKYSRTLEPGVNFIFPIIESIVLQDGIREELFHFPYIPARTKDGVDLEIDANIIFKIKDLNKAFYSIDNAFGIMPIIVEKIIIKKINSLSLKEMKVDEFDTLNDEVNEIVDKWGITVTHLNILEWYDIETIIKRKQEEIKQTVNSIDKKAEDAGIKTPQNSVTFDKLLEELIESINILVARPRYDLRGSHFTGGLADRVQGSQISGTINSDNRTYHGTSSQSSDPGLIDRDG